MHWHSRCRRRPQRPSDARFRRRTRRGHVLQSRQNPFWHFRQLICTVFLQESFDRSRVTVAGFISQYRTNFFEGNNFFSNFSECNVSFCSSFVIIASARACKLTLNERISSITPRSNFILLIFFCSFIF